MKITNPEWDGCLITCALRYNLGRCSYMPPTIMDMLSPLLKDMDNKTLWAAERDIEDFLHRRNPEGKLDYAVEWTEFLAKVKAELKRREQESKEI